MNIKKFAYVIAVSVFLTAAAIPAVSEPVPYSFEDDDVDAILRLNVNGGYNILTEGVLAINDVFLSVLEVPVFTINGINGIPAGQELTGVAAVRLVDIIGTQNGAGEWGVGTQYIFAPVPAADGGLDLILESFGYDGDYVMPEGSAIAMFLNGEPGAGDDQNLDLNRTQNPATNCATVADCVYQASLGNLFQVDGFKGDPDEFWAATQTAPGGSNIATILGTNNNVIISAYNLGLSNFFNSGGPVQYINIATGLYCGNPGLIADGCVQLSASGTISGGQGLSNAFIAHSDFDGQKYVENVIPEPSTLILLGLGLGIMGFVARRKA